MNTPIITDSTRQILEEQLTSARAERAGLDAQRAGLDHQLSEVTARLTVVQTIIVDIEDDLGITEPIEDPWAAPQADAEPEPEGAA